MLKLTMHTLRLQDIDPWNGVHGTCRAFLLIRSVSFRSIYPRYDIALVSRPARNAIVGLDAKHVLGVVSFLFFSCFPFFLCKTFTLSFRRWPGEVGRTGLAHASIEHGLTE